MQNKIPRIGVGVFVWKDGKFLMGQRYGAHGEGTWSVPGGHLEFNESWEACAAREVLEETNMSIKNVSFLAVTNDLFQAEDKHYVTVWMKADWDTGEAVITEPDKFVRFEWCSFNDLPAPLFLPWEQLRQTLPDLFPPQA